MISWLGKLLSYSMGQAAYQYLFTRVRKKAVLTYLKTLKVVRQSLLAAVLILMALQLMIIGFVGAIISGVLLNPNIDMQSKLWILFSLFLLIFFIPCLGLILFFSERTWLKISGAEKLLTEKH